MTKTEFKMADVRHLENRFLHNSASDRPISAILCKMKKNGMPKKTCDINCKFQKSKTVVRRSVNKLKMALCQILASMAMDELSSLCASLIVKTC